MCHILYVATAPGTFLLTCTRVQYYDTGKLHYSVPVYDIIQWNLATNTLGRYKFTCFVLDIYIEREVVLFSKVLNVLKPAI